MATVPSRVVANTAATLIDYRLSQRDLPPEIAEQALALRSLAKRLQADETHAALGGLILSWVSGHRQSKHVLEQLLEGIGHARARDVMRARPDEFSKVAEMVLIIVRPEMP